MRGEHSTVEIISTCMAGVDELRLMNLLYLINTGVLLVHVPEIGL